MASARSLSAGVGAHVTRGTLVLTGLPERAWPHLSTTDQFVDVVLTRPGRAEQHARIRIPAASALPYRAAPLPVSSTTIALAGRVTASAFPHGPVVGASITLSGTPTAPVVAVGVPLASAHPAGTTVRLRPVSYTHLDVYKRQRQSHPVATQRLPRDRQQRHQAPGRLR